MPLYFGTTAASCPTSRDQPLPTSGQYHFTRSSIPHATDYDSAVAAANAARTIVTSLTTSKTVNNVWDRFHKSHYQSKTIIEPDKYKLKTPRWTEQTKERVRRKYKYYLRNPDGSFDEDTWVIMERIERMVWYDRVWKTHLKWEYGDKGEGDPVS
jgi:hypothetical protein